ncbi:MAG TPA: hypothetical protein VHV53_04000 [Solirubrobacterales bacterium]|nr:hypothetical protein [Solirubrobacterales bacterium]
MDRGLYRRRQRRRAIIAWSVGCLVVALIALGVIFGSVEKHRSISSSTDLFAAEMTAQQYTAIHRGESEVVVLTRIHHVGLPEAEVEDKQLLGLFPPRPDHAICSYWTLSDAPAHLVRLCFSDPQGVLLQKSVAAVGEDAAPTTLA